MTPSAPSGPAARRAIPYVVLAVALVATLAAAYDVAVSSRARDQARFESGISRTELAIATRLETHIAMLRAGAALFGGGDRVTPEEFQFFVERLRLPSNYPGWLGIGLSVRLTPDRRDSVVRLVDRIVPDTVVAAIRDGRARYATISFEPLDRRNRAEIGADMFRDPVCRAAMIRARDSAAASASGRVALTPEVDRSRPAGFLIYVPVYEDGVVPPTAAERRQNLFGFVYSPFQADDLFGSVYRGYGITSVDVQIYDTTAVLPARLLYDSRLHRGETTDRVPRFTTTRRIRVAGRDWGLVFTSRPLLEEGRETVPLILLGGGLIGGALFGLTRAQIRARETAERAMLDMVQSRARARENELRFRTMVDQSPLSTQILDPSGRTLRVNQAWERLWGARLEDLDDYNLLEDQQLIERGIMALVRRAFAGEAAVLPEIPYFPPLGAYAGQELWIRAYIYPVRDEAGGVREVVLIHEDVTERRRAERAVLQAQKLESIGVLAGGIAHDFNNLLTGIMGNVSLARQAAPPESELAELLSDTMRAAERATDLTRQLLAYAGKGHFFIRPVRVPELVNELRGLIGTSVSKKVRLEFDLDPAVPPVQADSGQLQQLVMNLVINGAEAIGDYPGTLTVRVKARVLSADELRHEFSAPELEPGLYVTIEVHDTGTGMSAETRALIFDPFFTTKFIGRGLGLAAALGIVRSHRGTIAVWSVPGEGSRFTVALPASEQPGNPAGDPVGEAPRGTSAGATVARGGNPEPDR